MRILFCLTLSFFGFNLQVYANCGEKTEGKKIIFFGGYKANNTQLACWKQSAEKWKSETTNSAAVKNYEFLEPVVYPSMDSTKNVLNDKKAKEKINEIVDLVNDCEQQEFILIGHSSGSALANEVVRRAKNPVRMTFIVLDGFSPYGLKPETNLICVAAKNSGQAKSRNYNSMNSSACSGSLQTYETDECKGNDPSWCLHFSVVNKNSAKIDKTNYGKIAYGKEGCKDFEINLSWMPVYSNLKIDPGTQQR